MKHGIFSSILTLACTQCFAQKLLFHKNRNQELSYAIGDKISFTKSCFLLWTQATPC